MTPPAHRLQQSCKWTTLSWLHLHIDCSWHMTHEWTTIMTPPAHRPQQPSCERTTLSWLHLHTDCSHHESGPLYHDSTCIQTTGVIWVDHSIMTPPAHRPQVSCEWTTLLCLHLHTDWSHHESGPLYHDSNSTPFINISCDFILNLPKVYNNGGDKHTKTIMVVINILSTILMQLHEIINLIQNKPFSYHFQVIYIYISPHPQAIFFVPTEAEWWEWWLWPLPVLCICGFGAVSYTHLTLPTRRCV